MSTSLSTAFVLYIQSRLIHNPHSFYENVLTINNARARMVLGQRNRPDKLQSYIAATGNLNDLDKQSKNGDLTSVRERNKSTGNQMTSISDFDSVPDRREIIIEKV